MENLTLPKFFPGIDDWIVSCCPSSVKNLDVCYNGHFSRSSNNWCTITEKSSSWMFANEKRKSAFRNFWQWFHTNTISIFVYDGVQYSVILVITYNYIKQRVRLGLKVYDELDHRTYRTAYSFHSWIWFVQCRNVATKKSGWWECAKSLHITTS